MYVIHNFLPSKIHTRYLQVSFCLFLLCGCNHIKWFYLVVYTKPWKLIQFISGCALAKNAFNPLENGLLATIPLAKRSSKSNLLFLFK